MTIEDYALELGVDTSLVISKVRELGFKYNNPSDILDDDSDGGCKGNCPHCGGCD